MVRVRGWVIFLESPNKGRKIHTLCKDVCLGIRKLEREREIQREKRSSSMHEAGDLKVHVEGNLIRQCTDCDK